MRDGIRAIAVMACVLAATAHAVAQPSELAVAIEPPAAVRVGDRAEIVVSVTLPAANRRPLLVTPRSEGTAVEIVRGRFLRSDAEDPEASVLRFRIPIVARTEGDAIIEVHVRGYRCTRRCRDIERTERVLLRVQGAAHSANHHGKHREPCTLLACLPRDASHRRTLSLRTMRS